MAGNYTIMLRVKGIEGWQFGMYVSSAFAALSAQNYIRLNHFDTDVKIIRAAPCLSICGPAPTEGDKHAAT